MMLFIFSPFLIASSLVGSSRCESSHLRLKRDFMYVSSANDTEPQCFQSCNARWKDNFEYSLNTTLADFYEFPLHPLLLDHSSFLLYCKLAQQKTTCYMNQCNDQSADSVFSPSNFLCSFKRSLFMEARTCLSDAEPITFLKCDQECHEATKNVNEEEGYDNSLVYTEDELESYELELATLCTFQKCYVDCMVPIVKEVCTPKLASRAVELVNSFIKWHATDIYEWHVTSDRVSRLAVSCLALTDRNMTSEQEDPVVQLITAN